MKDTWLVWFAFLFDSFEDSSIHIFLGGGYVLSKKALKKIIANLNEPTSTCYKLWKHPESSLDDMFTGACLDKQAIFVNEMDELNQKRFFPLSVDEHLAGYIAEDWFFEYLWYKNQIGGLGCCSDTVCAIHYIHPKQLFELDYMIYHVHPFGVRKNETEKLPRKLTIKEIIAASDIKGVGSSYKNHKPVHHFESSELFRRK
jgi:glycoprotein-N-acetylgalactosamine 3-beta-galactosyltransferase